MNELKNIDNENAGKYRTHHVGISGSVHHPVHFLNVQEEMNHLFSWYEQNKTALHPVPLAAKLHFRLVYIHPFADGNGRTARLMMNFILMHHGYPPAIIKASPEHRLKYYESLEKASVEGELEPFTELVTKCAEESLTHYLQALGIEE
ncbi:Adenosine monophosphate-protein transferase and cysteine protease IbpA [Anoxybacillus sp. P3H1B]|uniref:Fic family protein n=1 Tax=Anoxybacillus sp. P3H1B TaxID=1769293 RepID=UPI0007940285|nr:Fic family protein [Anoxybacillus sp. P3H1B]KXG08349.1 Adenosine monophosphate-protein transferase and cysteine protease IbpA [Anoxybacillus sp. P3H1B]